MSDLPAQHDDRSVSFIQRWSQRKRQQHAATTEPPLTQDETPTHMAAPEPPVSEEDLPSIESLHEDSEVSMFLGEGISETLQRRALRTLFQMGKFNVCDGLDDYADDYSVFQPLHDVLKAQQHLRDMSEQLKQMQTDETAAPGIETAATKAIPPTPSHAESASEDESKES